MSSPASYSPSLLLLCLNRYDQNLRYNPCRTAPTNVDHSYSANSLDHCFDMEIMRIDWMTAANCIDPSKCLHRLTYMFRLIVGNVMVGRSITSSFIFCDWCHSRAMRVFFHGQMISASLALLLALLLLLQPTSSSLLLSISQCVLIVFRCLFRLRW